MILKQEVCKELCAEIEKVLPSLEYCLAPKKNKEASGASNLRSQVSQTVTQSDRDPIELDRHAKVLYEWLDKKERSYIRMIVAFPAYSGSPEVTLQEFQRCIKVRHTLGSRGNEPL